MNKDLVIASCDHAAEFLRVSLPDNELCLQLELAGYIDIFRKAVSGPQDGSSLKISDVVLTKMSADILDLSAVDSPLRDISHTTWQGVKALRPAVNDYLNFD